MVATSVDVVCPKCSHEFQLPLRKALTPLIDGEIKRRLDEQREEIIKKTRETAAKDSDERNQTAIAMRDKMIGDMRVQTDELRRKVDLGSQQVQGEVQELALENALRAAFPADRISPVEKGRSGGDTVHEVRGLNGAVAGAILWESKNTRTWSNEWLSKVKQDMRATNAVLCVIATATLLDIALIRAMTKQDGDTAEKLFSYVTGEQCFHPLSAVLEACIELQTDLDADKRATSRRWARNQKHIDALVQGMGGMFGDLQGLLGGRLRKLSGLALNGDAEAEQRAS